MLDYSKHYVCSGSMKLSDGQTEEQLFQDYCDAGVDVLKTTPFDFDIACQTDFISQVRASIAMAQTFNKPILGCVGPSRINLSQTNAHLDGFTHTKRVNELKDFYKRLVQVYNSSRVDAILVETVVDAQNLELILQITSRHKKPVFVTVTPDEDGYLLCGHHFTYAFSMAQAFNAKAVGFNCISAGRCMRLLKQIHQTHLPIVCNPSYNQDYSKHFKELKSYLFMLGGCCGTTPAIMKKLL